MDPGLLKFVLSSQFRGLERETNGNYGTDIRPLLTFLSARGVCWRRASRRDLVDYRDWRCRAAENPQRIGGTKWNRDVANYKEAARIVGVDPRTGRRWRNGRNASGGTVAAFPIDMSGASPKPSATPHDRPSRYLREADRIHIADRLREGATIRAIGAELGRSPSTVSREIRRNRHPGNGQYRPHAAQARADARRPRPKHSKISQNNELRTFIQDHLTLRWSPEQICNALRRQFPDRPKMYLAHETVYQALTTTSAEISSGN